MSDSNDNKESGSIDLDLFVGSTKSYNEFKRKHQIADTEEEKREAELERVGKKQGSSGSSKTVLSKETLTKIDDETMTILRRTRCVNDFEEVFMQSSLSFYDQYYNDTEATPELKAARQIRRLYTSSYSEYLEAVQIRNEYIDTLVEKYGGENAFMQKYQAGLVREWIPPVPKLSKRADDYELYLTGIIPTSCETLPEEEKKRIMEKIMEEASDMEVDESGGVETSYGEIKAVLEMIDEEYNGGYYNRGGYSSEIRSLEELNRVFKSWYKTDDGEVKHELFKNAPENIQKRFDEWRAYREPGLLARLGRGEEIEQPQINMNEQVHDEVTGRTMTRQEYENRRLIRFLGENGWSESRLLKYQNMSSSLDNMKRKTRANKKRKRNNYDDDDISYVVDTTGVDPMYSENEDVLNILSGLMRGD